VLKNISWDMGVHKLWPSWKALFTRKHLYHDTLAAVTVACVAIPLSMAIALASDVPAGVGLVSAVVGGVVAALLGGTPLAVSGPAAAMAVLVGTVLGKHGMHGLLMATLISGVFQLCTGVLRFGKLIEFVPSPVVSGFTAGIGAIILIGQLPRALGLPPPDESHVLDVLAHIGEFIAHTHGPSLILALLTLGSILFLRRKHPSFPGILAAVVGVSLLSGMLKLDVAIVGDIPRTLPWPSWPSAQGLDWPALLASAAMIYALGSLETLLSSSAVDKLHKGSKHNPDQELIGQGMANMTTALFGGIPVTGVIARSALNVQAGAKTRRSALLHSVFLCVLIFFCAGFLKHIPIAVLAGVLFSVALKMLDVDEFLSLWKVSQSDGLTYLITFASIVALDLIAGVQVGLAAAFVIAAVRMANMQSHVRLYKGDGPVTVSLKGSISFLSKTRLQKLIETALTDITQRGLVLDLSEVQHVDVSGGAALIDEIHTLVGKKIRISVKATSEGVVSFLQSLDTHNILNPLWVSSEQEALHKSSSSKAKQHINRLEFGVERYHQEVRPGYAQLFDALALSQNPHTLFITCSDSRLNPNLITSTEPGELFIIRNMGNTIPPLGYDQAPAEGAAIEFAVGVLGVQNIVVCGHSSCGAIKATLEGKVFQPPMCNHYPSLAQWLSLAQRSVHSPNMDDASKEHAQKQIQHLLSYPEVQKRVKEKTLQLHAWFFDIATGEVTVLSVDNMLKL
jgi:carbonic anhydrase